MDMLSHPKKLSTVDSHWRGEVLLARKHASSSHDHISILSLVILSTKVCFICLLLFKLMICLIYLFMMLLGINSRALYVHYTCNPLFSFYWDWGSSCYIWTHSVAQASLTKWYTHQWLYGSWVHRPDTTSFINTLALWNFISTVDHSLVSHLSLWS